jgi:hypothetical protein
MTNRIQQATAACIVFVVLLSALTNHAVNAFSLSMVATGSVGTRGLRVPSAPSTGVSSSIISHLAETALKRRLRDQSGVTCDVTANSGDMLFKGKVGPVTVKGKGWQSPLGLTCRALEATVDTCELDMGRVLSSQKLVLTRPGTCMCLFVTIHSNFCHYVRLFTYVPTFLIAQGTAMVALNGKDFGTFLTHPLLRQNAPCLQEGGECVEFLRDGASINPQSKSVVFFGKYEGETYKCTLQRGGKKQKALITVESQSPELESTATRLSSAISDFFNEMLFELDGTFLSFRDMMVTGKGVDPCVMLALQITVKKFPSPGLAF